MKKILTTIVIIGLIGAGVGLYMFNKPLESTSSMKVDYAMQASELLAAFEEDESTANTKYLDKVISVSGKVEKVENKEGKVTVYLDADNPMSNIIFQLENTESAPRSGDSATLKGVCTGYLMDVVMVRGVQV